MSMFERCADATRTRAKHSYERRGKPFVSHQFTLDKAYSKFQNAYRSLYFPRFEEDPNIFEGLMLHCKLSEDEDEEND